MIYLKKFETTAQYEAAESGLILPNVSLVSETNGVHYKPYVPTPSHEYVEIGGIKWATMNVGANSITDTGLYFQWGDTQGYTAAQVGSGSGKKYFGMDDYKYGVYEPGLEPDYGMTKYISTDGKTVLDASDDAVQAAWGGNWRMPTTDETTALFAAVNTAWTQVNGVSGMMFTDKTDSTKTLFFPVCGYAMDGSLMERASSACFWTSSLVPIVRANAYRGVMNLDWYGRGDDRRFYGYPVRGVLDE